MKLDNVFLKELAVELNEKVLINFVNLPSDQVIDNKQIDNEIVKYTWENYQLSSKDYAGKFDAVYEIDGLNIIRSLELKVIPVLTQTSLN